MTAEKLRRFYETYYRPNRALLVIAGDFNLDTMEQKIRDNFADWSASQPPTEETLFQT